MDLAVFESFLSWSVIVTFELERKHHRDWKTWLMHTWNSLYLKNKCKHAIDREPNPKHKEQNKLRLGGSSSRTEMSNEYPAQSNANTITFWTVRRWEIYTQRQLKQPSWKTSSCYWAIVATDTNKLFSAGERKHVRGFVWMKQHWHSHRTAVSLTSSEWTLQSQLRFVQC